MNINQSWTSIPLKLLINLNHVYSIVYKANEIAEHCFFLKGEWYSKYFSDLDGTPFSAGKSGTKKEILFNTKQQITEAKKKRREKLLSLCSSSTNYKVRKGFFKPPVVFTLKYLLREKKLRISFDTVHKNCFGEVMTI